VNPARRTYVTLFIRLQVCKAGVGVEELRSNLAGGFLRRGHQLVFQFKGAQLEQYLLLGVRGGMCFGLRCHNFFSFFIQDLLIAPRVRGNHRANGLVVCYISNRMTTMPQIVSRVQPTA